MGRTRWVALGIFALVTAGTWWSPRWPLEQALHGSLTVVGLTLLLWRGRRLPTSSFVLVIAFLTLHTIAARWIYSFVPYDDWADVVLGVRLSDSFGWHRNHFDRLVHVAYGLCAAPVVFAYFKTWQARHRALVAVTVVLATSALYELFEWGIAITLSPAAAEAYNGQQGDMWDAHADTGLALLGSVIAAGLCWISSIRQPTGS